MAVCFANRYIADCKHFGEYKIAKLKIIKKDTFNLTICVIIKNIYCSNGNKLESINKKK